MNAVTLDQLTSPVSSTALANWLRLDDADDPILSGLLLATTQCVIDWMQRDLFPRAWTVTYQDWPKPRQGIQLVYGWPDYCDSADLPYTQLISVNAVTVFGELLDAADYTVIAGNPAQVRFNSFIAQQATNTPAVVIEYTAGFEQIPEAIKTAITMAAAYMYDHRGSCSASEALTMSGASTLLHPYRARAGIAL